MINLSRDKNWVAIFITLTTGVYFASETLQLSPWIAEDSHYKSTVYSFGYNLLYSWLVAYLLITTNDIIIKKYPSDRVILLYGLFY